MEADELAARHPFLYHVTNARNEPGIEASGTILSAGRLLSACGDRRQQAAARGYRDENLLPVSTGEDTAYLRDHRMRESAIRWEPGWTMDRFVRLLNKHVFFWPGTGDQVAGPGFRFIQAYDGEDLRAVRVATEELVDLNGAMVRVAACNSGAPRRNPVSGRQPRGASTFVGLEDAHYSAACVWEVAVLASAKLPEDRQWLDPRTLGSGRDPRGRPRR